MDEIALFLLYLVFLGLFAWVLYWFYKRPKLMSLYQVMGDADYLIYRALSKGSRWKRVYYVYTTKDYKTFSRYGVFDTDNEAFADVSRRAVEKPGNKQVHFDPKKYLFTQAPGWNVVMPRYHKDDDYMSVWQLTPQHILDEKAKNFIRFFFGEPNLARQDKLNKKGSTLRARIRLPK